MPKKATRKRVSVRRQALKKYRRKKSISSLNIMVGQKISFLHSGFVCPKFILIGTVVHKEEQRGGVRYIYTVSVKSQEVFDIRDTKPSDEEVKSLLFSDEYVPDFETKIIDECVSNLKKYSYISTPCGLKLYYRKTVA